MSPPISPRIQLVVEFVDGVTRLELMKKADELKVVTYSLILMVVLV